MKAQEAFHLNEKGYFEKRGANVFVFNNDYNDYFGDSKISGVEFIHHGVRTVTNGDVRINRTPEQWDPIPVIVSKNVDTNNETVEVELSYRDYNFTYWLVVAPNKKGIRLTVRTNEPLPNELVGKAALHMEFLPAIYGGKTYYANQKVGVFAHYPSDQMEMIESKPEPVALAKGTSFTLSPEEESSGLRIESDIAMSLYDGRNQAQNGWFVLQSLLPGSKTGELVSWNIDFNTIPDWIRQPVIAHSQVGYHPNQQKLASIELDANDNRSLPLQLIKVKAMNDETVKNLTTSKWGMYKRYQYLQADFTEVAEEGTYYLKYGDVKTAPFIISNEVYKTIWHPTLDIFFPVQMDHMHINEAYRVWHGRSHLDDARQAPINHTHFDLYAQGETTDSPYEPGEHIPGLNIGGWYDAGDYDIRTQTQYHVLLQLVRTWEQFQPERDQTFVDQDFRYVDLHHPDGTPDVLQQIYHGALALMAQYDAIGHAIPGIVSPDLSQYTHLGDGMTKTDNLVFDAESDSIGSNGKTSAVPDDRWAFTTRTTSLTYGSVAALAAASRALKSTYPEFAEKCLETAKVAFAEEQQREPTTFRFGNTTGGNAQDEQIKATLEMIKTTAEEQYVNALKAIWPTIKERFRQNSGNVLSMYELLTKKQQNQVRDWCEEMVGDSDGMISSNPFGVLITEGGWAGNGSIVGIGINNYWIHKRFPDLMSKEATLASLNYLFGHHPDSDISFVSGIGANTKKVAYGSNRADYSYIPGGIVPGVLILPPDFPENKENWPFLWGENEYVISLGASYLFLALAADELLIEN